MTRTTFSGFSSVMGHGGWRAASSGERRRVPNYELDAAVCVGPEQLARYVKHAHGWRSVKEGSRLHPKPGYLATSGEDNDLGLCYPVTSVCRDATLCVGRVVLAAFGYLRSYDDVMGVARVRCSSGCTCEENTRMTFDGRHSLKNSVTWVSWLALNLTAAAFKEQRATCPCTVHVTAGPRRKAKQPQYRFKVSMMMLSHQGDMSWVDPWKTLWQSVGDSEPTRRRRLQEVMIAPS